MSIAPTSTASAADSISSPALTSRFDLRDFRYRLAAYRELCRPRIAVMTMVSVVVGFTLSSPIVFNGLTLLIAAFGIVQLVAASSILNQCLERATDLRMTRTESRPIPSGSVPLTEAFCLAVCLTFSGVAVLLAFVNTLTAFSTLLTLLIYVFAYTPLKTRSALCTTIGAVPGAMPPVLGWFAAGGNAGFEALALFAVFFVWQFPHFLAIGWIHRKDYERAGLKMLPSFSDGGFLTGLIAAVYAVAFVPVVALPTAAGVTGDLYLWLATLLAVIYLIYTLRFFSSRTEKTARSLLYNSLLCLPLLLLTLVIDFVRLTWM